MDLSAHQEDDKSPGSHLCQQQRTREGNQLRAVECFANTRAFPKWSSQIHRKYVLNRAQKLLELYWKLCSVVFTKWYVPQGPCLITVINLTINNRCPFHLLNACLYLSY